MKYYHILINYLTRHHAQCGGLSIYLGMIYLLFLYSSKWKGSAFQYTMMAIMTISAFAVLIGIIRILIKESKKQ